jgi:hypothetical protein
MAARLLKQNNRPVRSKGSVPERRTVPDGKASMSTDTEVYFSDFLQEAAAFDRQLPQLLERFQGEYVAVYQGEVIDHSKSWDELAEKVHQRVPNRFVLLERVVPKSGNVVHMESVGT